MTDEAEALKPCPREPDMVMLLAMHNGPLCAGDEIMGDSQRKWLREMWQAGYDAAPKSLEIPREIAALRELVAVVDLLTRVEEEDRRGDIETRNELYDDYARRKPLAWAAARSALAMYDQERG